MMNNIFINHFGAILGLAVLCGAWVGLQIWVFKVDPELAHKSSSCKGCGNYHCENQ